MAQTGYSKIQIYSSSTATDTPSAGNLTNDTNGSELAINITDGKLFYKDNSGTVQVLATKGSGVVGGSNTQVQYNSSGTFAGSANLTFDGTTLTSSGFSGPLNGTVGATTANTGAFTTLSASSTVSGTGFSTYLASPPAIGGTAAANVTGTIVKATTNFTFQDNTTQKTAATGFGFKNRIINGAMVISQRGTSFTGSNISGNAYTLDRYTCSITSPSSATITQSSGAPAGFTSSFLFTNTTGGAIGSNLNFFGQIIEGYNIADLGWGTANAKTVTLSFWVQSSITGTFGGAIRNYVISPATSFRSYPFTYTISFANTWTQVSVTIPGDGTGGAGQWNTGNQGSLVVWFDFGTTSAYTGTAGSWSGANYVGATGTQTTLIPTNGATWNMTGLQLEAGSTATSFDYRPYGTELNLCQRYFETITSTGYNYIVGQCISTSSARIGFPFAVAKRASPSLSIQGTWYLNSATDSSVGSITLGAYGTTLSSAGLTLAGMSGLVAGNATSIWPAAVTGYIYVSSEL